MRSILLLLNVLFALMIWFTWRSPPLATSELEVKPSEPSSLQLPSSPLRRLSFAHYQELLARPLFWSERRALAKEPQIEVTTSNQPMAFQLIGVVMSPQSKHALLGKSGAKEVIKVQEGDIVEGWQIEAVNVDSVRLNRRGERQLITLDEKRESARLVPGQ